MRIRNESIGHFIQLIRSDQYFSLAGFSDAEWYCILGQRVGEKTGLGQIITMEHGVRLLDVIRRRQRQKRFMFAIPKCLYEVSGLCDGQMDWMLGRENIQIEAYERDALTDDLARKAELAPFIRLMAQLPPRKAVVMIGPAELRNCGYFLHYHHFVEISTPNLHLEPGGIERAVKSALGFGKPGAYLVSAGVSAAIIIDQLHDRLCDSWIMDCGSIWDAFVGIGGQRQWRAELYADPEKMEAWRKKNLGIL